MPELLDLRDRIELKRFREHLARVTKRLSEGRHRRLESSASKNESYFELVKSGLDPLISDIYKMMRSRWKDRVVTIPTTLSVHGGVSWHEITRIPSEEKTPNAPRFLTNAVSIFSDTRYLIPDRSTISSSSIVIRSTLAKPREISRGDAGVEDVVKALGLKRNENFATREN